MNNRQSKLLNKRSRRDFLKEAAALGSAGLGFAGYPGSVLANTTGGDYKALVCMFMFGGMDHDDTIIPMDATSHATLKEVRPEIFDAYTAAGGSRSREVNNLLALDPINNLATEGRRYGMPQELAPLHELFEAEELAIVGGVGPLIEPTTRQLFENGGVRLPPALFSHNDQQNYWQGLKPEGAAVGWGGQFMDSLVRQGKAGDARFTSISATGSNLFLAGEDVSSYRVTPTGPLGVSVTDSPDMLGDNALGNQLRERMAAHLRRSGLADNILKNDFQNLRTEAMHANDIFSESFNSLSPIATSFPDTSFGRQMQSVAKAMQTGQLLGLKRQIFFVGGGGFDTHNNQAETLPGLQSNLANAVKAFRDAMVELQMWNATTVFSAADFGRSMVSNGTGTDHGWGSHHFVTGGSVRGKHIAGRMPDYNLNGEQYTESRARLIPTIPVERYSLELGQWFGVDADAYREVLPNLWNFPSQPLNLFNS